MDFAHHSAKPTVKPMHSPHCQRFFCRVHRRGMTFAVSAKGSNMTQPILKLQDGLLSATIWKNQRENGSHRYSVTLTRSFKQGDDWRESNSFSRMEALRISRLAGFAYDEILLMVESDRRNASDPKGGAS
jgi:hypothetical protein